jgi:hypothetical protein
MSAVKISSAGVISLPSTSDRPGSTLAPDEGTALLRLTSLSRAVILTRTTPCIPNTEIDCAMNQEGKPMIGLWFRHWKGIGN